MAFDWLKTLRGGRNGRRSTRRRVDRGLGSITPLEQRTLLSAVPIGPEFRVNTTTLNDQALPKVAYDAQGDFVITWTDVDDRDYPSSASVYARRYSSNGNPKGEEFRVSSSVDGLHGLSEVGVDADGDFVVVWTKYDPTDDSNSRIMARRYDADGDPLSDEYEISTTRSVNPKIVMEPDGDFVVTWWGAGETNARSFSSNGVPRGNEFRVELAESIDMDSSGRIVSVGQTFQTDEIWGRLYGSDGLPLGDRFLVSPPRQPFPSYEGTHVRFPSVSMDSQGGFVVTWEAWGPDFDKNIYARRFDQQGQPLGEAFRVNTYTVYGQYLPVVSADASGNFVIAWESYGENGKQGIRAQLFSSIGTPRGEEFQVHSYPSGYKTEPSVALNEDGDFIITWYSDDQDGSGYGVYAQRYHINNLAPVLDNVGTPTFDPLLQNVTEANNSGTLVSELIARMAPSGSITDLDPDSLQGIAVNGLTGTANGTWQYTVNGGTNWTPMTVTGNANALLLAADGNTRIRFLPNAGFLGEAKIAFVAWDRTSGANGGTANVTTRGGTTPYSLAYEYASINVVNVAPVLDADGTPTLDPVLTNAYNVNNPGTLVSDIIARMAPNGGISDANPGTLQGIAINGLLNTDKGSWQFTTNGGTSWISIGTTGNSNARLLAADPNTRIRFVPIAGFAGTASFAFVAWDRTTGANGGIASVGTRGGSTAYSTAFDYASISVVNAAPVLSDLGAPLLEGILPNTPDASNPGTLVSTIMSRMSPGGSVTDANPSALRGIAVIGKTATATGTWEYSTNNGTTWLAINATGGANALLLASDANTRVRYRPNAGFRGEAKIAFTAWDQTTGTNGGTVNASTRGGTTAFSLAYEYASIFVNTAPTLDASGPPTLDAIPNTISNVANIGTPVNTILNRMAPGGITDPDPGALRGMAIIGMTGTANGTWQYTIDNGTNWSNILTTGSANALLLSNTSTTKIRFVPNPGFVGTASIAFTAWDRTQGVNGTIVNAGLRGGATPFSSLFDYAAISVTV